MQRLRQNWKIIAYLVGLIALAVSPLETVGSIYGLAGLAWFVTYVVRNGSSEAHSAPDVQSERGEDLLSRADDTEPMSVYYESYFDRA